MAIDGFDEGVAPGGLKDSDNIKILICYLLNSVDRPLSFENLNEIIQNDGLCNYFGFASALHELLVSGHVDLIKENDSEFYKVTSIGTGTAELLERRLPAAVRDKAINAAVKLLARIKRESENIVEIVEDGKGGFNVICRVLDMGDTLMELKLFVADRVQAEAVKRQFQNYPEIIYKGVLSLMTGDVKAAAELVKPVEND